MSNDESAQPQEPVSVYDHLAHILDLMAQVSWAKLGLQPDIMTGKIETNLAEAKVAIDTTAYLANLVDSQLDEADRRRVQGLVRDLRINYVQKTSEVGG
ncbi:MAG TPA: DUF1844 domain-containing protein [Fimbriimonas sp.]